MSSAIIPFIFVGLAVLAIAVVVSVARRYVKCAPNKVLVVFGRKRTVEIEEPVMGEPEEGGGRPSITYEKKKVEKGFRLITGGATFVLPFFESVASMDLGTFQTEFQVQDAPNVDGVQVTVDALANIKISSNPNRLYAGVERLLDKNLQSLKELAQSTLEGQLREIVGTLTVEAIVKNREEINRKVMETSIIELGKLGFDLDNFVVKAITDKEGYIEALGKKKTAEVKRDAAIGEAEAKREETIKTSDAEKEGQTKKLKNDEAIAQADRDLKVKKAELKKETETAESDAEYARKLQDAANTKLLNIKDADAEAADKEARISVQEKEALRMEKELIATKIKPAEATREALVIEAEGKKKAKVIEAEGDADAAVKTATGQAEATEKKAAAEKIKLQAEGEGKAAADAAIARQIGLAEAEVVKAKGNSEGEAIKARLVAEADGFRAKNDALSQMSDGARTVIILELLPGIIEQGGDALKQVVAEMFGPIGTSLSRIDSLNIVDFGGGNGDGNGSNPIEKLAMAAPKTVFKVFSELKALGVDTDSILQKLGLGNILGKVSDAADSGDGDAVILDPTQKTASSSKE